MPNSIAPLRPTGITVAHAIASIDDLAAGPSTSVPALAANSARHGAKASIHSVLGWRRASPQTEVEGVDLFRHRPSTGPLGQSAAASPSLRAALFAAARNVDIIHAHGLWLFPNIYPAEAVRQRGASAKLVISPRGMLGPAALAFSAGRKRVFWALLQRRAAEAAHCLHATAESEYAEVRAMGLRQPVAVIPNGVDIPALPARSADSVRTVLSLGRIHPKKGLEQLLRAWALVEPANPRWRLRIVGASENGHDEELRRLGSHLRLNRVAIEGPAFADDKLRAFADADLFVLPSLNENFAMTVAEALACGVPVIATHGAPWGGLAKESCGWWIPHGPEPLAKALASAMTMDDETRRLMGARGKAWIARAFSWHRVATDMLEVYRWLIVGGQPPMTVRTT